MSETRCRPLHKTPPPTSPIDTNDKIDTRHSTDRPDQSRLNKLDQPISSDVVEQVRARRHPHSWLEGMVSLIAEGTCRWNGDALIDPGLALGLVNSCTCNSAQLHGADGNANATIR